MRSGPFLSVAIVSLQVAGSDNRMVGRRPSLSSPRRLRSDTKTLVDSMPIATSGINLLASLDHMYS